MHKYHTAFVRPQTRGPLVILPFVLCMERLAHWIEACVQGGAWKPVKASRNGPCISHLFFADDIMLFAEASEDQEALIRTGLQYFCLASGQKVNFQKSTVFFSLNVSNEVANDLSQNLGIAITQDIGKYLGFNLLHKG